MAFQFLLFRYRTYEHTNSRRTNKYYWKDEDFKKKNTFNKLNERLPMSLSYFKQTRWFCHQVIKFIRIEMQAFCKNSNRKCYVMRVLFHETLFLFLFSLLNLFSRKKLQLSDFLQNNNTHSSGNFWANKNYIQLKKCSHKHKNKKRSWFMNMFQKTKECLTWSRDRLVLIKTVSSLLMMWSSNTTRSSDKVMIFSFDQWPMYK